MKIPVAALGPDGAVLEGEGTLAEFGWVEAPGDIVHPVSGARYRLEARLFGGEALVTGRAEASFEGVCGRCCAPFSAVYGDDLEASFKITPETTEIDLTSELRETILLALPAHPVCSPGCAGLCPRCGKRLADGPCGCPPSGAEASPWGALDSLFPKTK